MSPMESLQYLATIAGDFVRALPASAQGPTTAACNEALTTLAPLVQTTEPVAMLNGDARQADEKKAPQESRGLPVGL